MTQTEMKKIWQKIVAQAWADENFKTALLKDPEAVMKAEGIEVPVGRKIRVVEAASDEVVFLLPAALKGKGSEETDERLAAHIQ